jgi:hypothetical protein
MVIPESCPACGSTRYKKNGHTRHGKQNHLCKKSERQFSAGAANRRVSAERRAEIANLLRERIPLRGICRVLSQFLFEALCGIIVLSEQPCLMRESDDGDRFQRGSFPPEVILMGIRWYVWRTR